MLGQRWIARIPFVPNDASPDLVAKFILVRYALSRIGLRGVASNRKYVLPSNCFQLRSCSASTLSSSLRERSALSM